MSGPTHCDYLHQVCSVNHVDFFSLYIEAIFCCILMGDASLKVIILHLIIIVNYNFLFFFYYMISKMNK